MISQQIAPLGVRDIDPGSGTADAGGYAECSDGQTYVLKPASLHPLLPATEAFCETLGIACQLPVTVGAWIQLPDGTECYGSRWEGGLVRPLSAGTLMPLQLQMLQRRRQWQRCSAPGIATAMFAFDLFVFNCDRHHNNWTFHEQNGQLTARAFDFSRAIWTLSSQGFADLPAPPEMQALPPAAERTCATFRDVSRWAGKDFLLAGQVLQLLERIPPAWVQNQLSSLPAGWIDSATLAATVQWWASPDRQARIDSIRQGLSNGTLC